MRCLVVFMVLLFGLSAVPVFADGPPSEPPPSDALNWASESEAQALPDVADVAEGMRELEEREEAKQLWLEGDQAEQQREESQDAFAGASVTEAAALLESEFSDQLDQLDQDPARALSEVKLDQVLSPTDALITRDGDKMLLEGTTPVRVPGEDGDLSKVDLDLVASGDGFEPANPITNLTLPRQASEGIVMWDTGLTVTPALSQGDSTAERFGPRDLLYPETQTDTSILASPISSGVELSAELLSEESPEEVRLDLGLPAGAELRSDGSGGAEVVSGDQQLARVLPPTALDAQGSDVPVDMRVESSTLVLSIKHRQGDFAYPLLVDPPIQENWYDGNNWWWGQSLWALEPGTSPWIWGTNDGGRFWAGTHHIYHQWNGSDRGLFISGTSTSGSQPANHFGEFTYTAPGSDGFIPAALISPFWRDDHGCTDLGKYPEPHDYTGLWSDTWGWATFHRDWAHSYGYGIEQPATQLAPQDKWRENTGHVLVIGMGTGNGTAASMPCWRDIYAGGVALWLDDWYSPSLGTVSGVPSGWVAGTKQFTINVSATDTGLGVRFITITPANTAIIQDQVGCTGLSNSRCPSSRNHAFVLTGANFDQGQQTASIVAEDPTGKVSAKYTFETKVDRSPPEVELSGQLATQTGEQVAFGEKEPPQSNGSDELSLPVYNLQIKARDGSNATSQQKRSGVERIEVFLDKKETPEQVWSKECPLSSCEMSQTFSLKMQELSSGNHTLRVVAADALKQKLERKVEFEYVPGTGISDDFITQRFPLPSGEGNEAEEENPRRPELAVNVMNGNLVYRERDVEVTGPGADLEVERIYNSMLPNDLNTEWGDGWSLAQTPTLKPEDTGGSPAPDQAQLIESSGTVRAAVPLPAEIGTKQFVPTLNATITKEANGFKVSDETGSGPPAVAFSESGKAEEQRTEGYAKVDYSYVSGKLSGIAVSDPASASEATTEAKGNLSPSTYSTVFGSVGSENGHLEAPGDVAIDASGNIWVADKSNDRIQKFSASGQYLSKFGSAGSATGQFNRPSSLAIDAKGNIWVADAGNDRIQRFNEKGEFIKAVGSYGSGNGQFASPEGIALDAKGNVWVADTYNGRLQELSESGAFIQSVGSQGSGMGQLGEPAAIDIGPGGSVWVADLQNNRLAEFSEAGTFIAQFGSLGPGDGQLKQPSGIDVDGLGNVWVTDTGNGRVEAFSQSGAYLTQFGANGSGAGQFSFASPAGISSDGKGALWIADPNNSRVQKWIEGTYAPPAEEDNDPAVEVATTSGLVSRVEGPEAGENTYTYSGDDLISHSGSQGQTIYSYDSAGRMTKVELPNGTYGAITYNATYGRVASVKVDPAGSESAKTTYFSYSDEPRRTTVTPEGAPAVVYDIGADGSVVKWWNAKEPPKFNDLGGSLYGFKETAEALPTGDQVLDVEGYSPEGISSVKVIVNNDQLAHETTCEQDYEEPGTECTYLPSEWVMNTANAAPGILYIEAVITDRLGQAESRRFWVNIPPPPPPPAPGSPIAPTFDQVLEFREEYGLDIVDPVANELERNDRIFSLLAAWWEGNPVARATAERWGVPLRTKDVEELEYRERYLAQDGPLIAQWAESQAPETYAGYYIDHRAGGKIRIGFTVNQTSQVESIRHLGDLIAEDRITTFTTEPSWPLAHLRSLARDLAQDTPSHPDITALLTASHINIKANQVVLGATNPSVVSAYLTGRYGSTTAISTVFDPNKPKLRSEEFQRQRFLDNRLFAGDLVDPGCTLAFGAWEEKPQKVTNERIFANFALGAGHCYPVLGERVRKLGFQRENNGQVFENVPSAPFGTVRRRSNAQVIAGYETDSAAIRLDDGTDVPRWIYWSAGYQSKINGVEEYVPGMTLCYSGASAGTHCAPTSSYVVEAFYLDATARTWQIEMNVYGEGGDSGAPVWNPISGAAVGLVTGGPPQLTWVTPLLDLEGLRGPRDEEVPVGTAPGALNAPGMAPALHVVDCCG